MRPSIVVQTVIFLLVAAGLGYLVVQVAKGWAGWVVFGVLVAAMVRPANADQPTRRAVPSAKRSGSADA